MITKAASNQTLFAYLFLESVKNYHKLFYTYYYISATHEFFALLIAHNFML